MITAGYKLCCSPYVGAGSETGCKDKEIMISTVFHHTTSIPTIAGSLNWFTFDLPRLPKHTLSPHPLIPMAWLYILYVHDTHTMGDTSRSHNTQKHRHSL